MSRRILGYIVGEALPYKFTIASDKPVRVGDYGVVEHGDMRALCMVERAASGSGVLAGSARPMVVKRIHELAEERGEGVLDLYYLASMQVLTDLDAVREGRPRIPSEPPPPSTPVWEAERDELEGVYAPGSRRWVRIGRLLRNEEVEVRIDVNSIVTRHLAVLSMTGYGKSNLVAVLADRIGGLGGTVVIFDVHGEYSGIRAKWAKVRRAPAVINPLGLGERELADLLDFPPQASRQRILLGEAMRNARGRFDVETMRSGEFLDIIEGELGRKAVDCKGRECEVARSALERFRSARRWYSSVFDTNAVSPAESIVEGVVNVIDVSGLTDMQLDAVVSHYLSSIFLDRRRAYRRTRSNLKSPVVVVVEEAHVLLPANGESATKQWAGRIAREGRKFGVGLVAISQRPRRIDQDVLSQMSSMALMRITQREDQASIRSATEGLSEELVEQLSGLNPGEALLMGPWVRMPALVKVDLHEGKLVGGDVDAMSEWQRPSSGPAESDLLDLG